jgi:hypothetical protein
MGSLYGRPNKKRRLFVSFDPEGRISAVAGLYRGKPDYRFGMETHFYY